VGQAPGNWDLLALLARGGDRGEMGVSVLCR